MSPSNFFFLWADEVVVSFDWAKDVMQLSPACFLPNQNSQLMTTFDFRTESLSARDQNASSKNPKPYYGS